jgi:hypothetical protein
MLSPEVTIKVKLVGSISTTCYGHDKLLRLYNECNQYHNTAITVCFKDLKWIDANMAALLQAIVNKLERENELVLLADLTKSKMDYLFLFRNGFFKEEGAFIEQTGTSIRLKDFSKGDDDKFVEYIESDFIDFPRLVLSRDSKEVMIQCLIEIFNNYEIHSIANHPIHLCGQYYPTRKKLKFTIVDVGIGFFKPISEKSSQIESSEQAINWALVLGNTTKKDAPGGLGLPELLQSMKDNNGYLEIISGDAYKSLGIKNGMPFETCKLLKHNHIGTTINLVFNEL